MTSFKWNQSEVCKLLRSEDMAALLWARASSMQDEINAEAMPHVKGRLSSEHVPLYGMNIHKGRYTCVARIRPRSRIADAIEAKYKLLNARDQRGL